MTLPSLRTIYNGPDRIDLGTVRADELHAGDLVSAYINGIHVGGQVDRITPLPAHRIRLRLVDDLDGRHHGESTYRTDQQFRARRITNAGRTS